MTIKRIQIIPPGNTRSDILHPETDSQMVLMESGQTLKDAFQIGGPYGTTAGTGAAYTVAASPPLTSLVGGSLVVVKIHTDNTGPATIHVNGLGAKTIKRGNGNDLVAGTLKANSIYSLRYNGVNFILQGEGGGSGDATAANILAGKTASTDAGDVVGTMADRAGDTAALSSVVSGTTLKLRASDGYRDGVDDFVTITDADFVSANILSGIDIFGLAGTLVQGKKWATGVTMAGNQILTVTGLSFLPKFIIAYLTVGDTNILGSSSAFIFPSEMVDYAAGTRAGFWAARLNNGSADSGATVPTNTALHNASFGQFSIYTFESNKDYKWYAFD